MNIFHTTKTLDTIRHRRAWRQRKSAYSQNKGTANRMTSDISPKQILVLIGETEVNTAHK